MGIKPSAPESPDVEAAARVEAETNRLAADTETWANRPDQNGPTGSVSWDQQMVDSRTGRPIVQDRYGRWVFADSESDPGYVARPDNYDDRYNDSSDRYHEYANDNPNAIGNLDEWKAYRAYVADQARISGNIEQVTDWTQNTTLNPEWQASLDSGRELMDRQTAYRSGQTEQWAANPVDFGGGVGGGSIKPGQTISTGDLAQFGQTSPNLGAQDWRQFGSTNPTIGADDYRQFGTTDAQITGDDWRQFGTTNPQISGDDWRQFGTTEQTIGQDDWQQYGNTEQTLTGDSYDERFGEANADPTGGYGAHDQGGSDWDQIQYTPDAIRRQAEQETLGFMNSQLDPQWDTRMNDLEVKLTNQGLQWGDAAFDNAMESMKNSRDQAYSGARNQALADSRSEASMLWDQEMGRSEQKNFQTQADLNNIYRARQANIGNYQSTAGQEQQNYLAYQKEAFGQDLASRQQTLDSDLNFGREAWNQDFNNRQQQLNANLDYGREGFQQDLYSRQQQLDANLDYGREGFQQDLQGRQQQLDADLRYGSEAFNQDRTSRQDDVNNNLRYSDSAFNQDRTARQDNISNYLNYGSEAFNQDLQGNQLNLAAMSEAERAQLARYNAINPGETAASINSLM